jgi:hypothetical protein
MMILLILDKFRRLGEGNRDNRDAASLEFSFGGSHLAEVMLARQSGKVPEKNQKRALLKLVGQRYSLPDKVTQP